MSIVGSKPQSRVGGLALDGLARFTVLGLEASLVPLAGILAWYIRFGPTAIDSRYIAAILIAVFCVAAFGYVAGLYRDDYLTHPARRLIRAIGVWILVFLFLIVIGFLSKTSVQYSRLWAGTWAIAGLFGFAASNLLLYIGLRHLKNLGFADRRVALLGRPYYVDALLRRFSEYQGEMFNVVSIYSELCSPENQLRSPAGTGSIDLLLEDIRNRRINEVVIAVPWNQTGRIMELVEILRRTPVSVRLSPEPDSFLFVDRPPIDVGGVRMLSLMDQPLSYSEWLLKELEDRVFSFVGLLCAMPVFVLVALAIKLDSRGPVFFRQERFGFNNEIIRVIKFRSMVASSAADPAAPQACRNDPRVTRIGAFLRRTSLDELPQLINVLKGEMSLVGPRPHAVRHNQEFARKIDDYFARHNVKPGITGWAQVNGFRGEIHSEEDLIERVRFDLDYIENWSLGFDLRILIRTLATVLFQKQAY